MNPIKKPHLVVSTLLIAAAMIVLTGCPKPEETGTVITGTVTDTKNQPIPTATATVYVWIKEGSEPKEVVLDVKEGKLNGKLPVGSKYVVNIRAKGYGLVSKVFYGSVPEKGYQLKKSTEVSITPSAGGTVTDTQNNCPGSLSFQANWASNPLAGVPIQINSDGKISGFGMPKELNDAYYYHAKAANCNSNITVNFPANSIAASAPVTVSMSAIDIFSADGMPGDNSADFGNGTSMMESFGAFSVDIYDNEKFYNLNKESKERVTVTIAAGMFPSKDLPTSVPILSYNEKSGIWEKEGDAKLDSTKKAYVGTVSHFSAVNFDIEKVTPSCLRFKDKSGDSFDPPYKAEVTVIPTGGGMPVVQNRDISAGDLCTGTSDRQFALTRLPENTSATVVFFTGTTPKAVYVVKTPGTNPVLVDRTRPNCADLDVASPQMCGNFTEIDQAPFGTTDIIVAACRNGTELTISIASKNPIVPADYQLKITQAACAGTTDLTSLTLIESTTASPPVINFQILKYRITGCAANLDETVEVVLKSSSATLSNVFLIAPSCSL